MAMTLQELELQTATYLPDREVMSGCQRRNHCGCNSTWVGDDQNNNTQFGLINVNVQDVNVLAID
jgi:hypothetical protein